MAHIRAGYGFNVGQDFCRTKLDTPIELAPHEYAKPRHIIGYIEGDMSHPLGFMRQKRVRVHVQLDAIES